MTAVCAQFALLIWQCALLKQFPENLLGFVIEKQHNLSLQALLSTIKENNIERICLQ